MTTCVTEGVRQERHWRGAGEGVAAAPGGITPIHYLYGYVLPNGVMILKLLI